MICGDATVKHFGVGDLGPRSTIESGYYDAVQVKTVRKCPVA
jgi:hypothetical protein